MEVIRNYYKLTKDQNKQIKQIKQKHIILQDYLEEVCKYMEKQGIKIIFDEIPSKFIIDGPKGTGWYGPISGSIENLISKEKIYSGSLWESTFNKTNSEPILEVDPGTGNGGSIFNYYNTTFLSVKTLPNFDVEKFNREEQEEETKKLNEMIKPLRHNWYSKVSNTRDEKDKNEEFKELNKIYKQLEKLDSDYLLCSYIKRRIDRISSNYFKESYKENEIKLPKITHPFVDTTDYYKFNQDINCCRNKKIVVFDEDNSTSEMIKQGIKAIFKAKKVITN